MLGFKRPFGSWPDDCYLVIPAATEEHEERFQELTRALKLRMIPYSPPDSIHIGMMGIGLHHQHRRKAEAIALKIAARSAGSWQFSSAP